RPLAPGGTARPRQALRAGVPLVALVALRPLAARRADRPWGTRRPDTSGRTHLAGWPRRAPWWSHRSSGARGARRTLQTRRSRSSGLPIGAWRAVRARLTVLPILARRPGEPEVPDIDLSFLLGAEADAHEERAVLLLTQHARLGVRGAGNSHAQCDQRCCKSEDESGSERDHRMAGVPGDVTVQCCPGQWFSEQPLVCDRQCVVA